MAGVEKDLRSLAAYLCVPCGNLSVSKTGQIPCLKGSNGTPVQGLASISKYLVQQSKKKQLLGETAEEQALVSQWLEYRVTNVDRCASRIDIELVLKELNKHLADKAYFLGNHSTLADLVLFHGLHCILNSLEHADRQKYMHVSRWFNNMQHLPGVRQTLSEIPFIKTPIYSH